MADLKVRVGNVVKTLPAEFRVPVITAVNVCDGSAESFRSEVEAQAYDYPDLPVQLILERVGA